MIKIKCDYVGGAVAVPTDVLDKHLKLASAASFKVLLFILRNPDGASDAQQISACTGLSAEDVSACLKYWEASNVISIDDAVDELLKKSAMGNAKAVEKEEKPVVELREKKKVRSLPVKKPTQREIALRISQEPELTLIYNEAQTILGTFGYDTQALILMIYDYYGFPPEVIITLLQHQKDERKLSSSAIKSRAEDWASRGIDNLEAVGEELLALEKVKEVYESIKGSLGEGNNALSPRLSKYIREWAVNWNCSKELIIYALEESNKTFSDANKLLKKYANSGIKTPEEAQAKEKKSLPKDVKKSYDTEKVGNRTVLEWAQRFAAEEENK